MAVEVRRNAEACEIPGGGVAPTLPGTDYWSPGVFEEDRRRIFHGGWVCLGRGEELPRPGDYLVRDLIDESLLLVRDQGGRIRAFYNVCRHRGSRICEGQGHAGNALRCPYHSWTYGLDGCLLHTPNVGDVEGFDRGDYPLHGVAAETWQGFIFVNLAPDPRSLVESLEPWVLDYERYAMDRLRTAHRIVYDVAANWKIVCENYSECLHCPGVHPELVRLIPLYRRGLVGDLVDSAAALDQGVMSLTSSGESRWPTLPGITEEDRSSYRGIVVFPNLLINFQPDYVMSYYLLPTGPARTTVVSEYLFEPSTVALPGFDPREAVELWDLISHQDWGVCERAQRGVQSRSYDHGVYPPQDRMVYEFNQQYLRARGGPGTP